MYTYICIYNIYINTYICMCINSKREIWHFCPRFCVTPRSSKVKVPNKYFSHNKLSFEY